MVEGNVNAGDGIIGCQVVVIRAGHIDEEILRTVVGQSYGAVGAAAGLGIGALTRKSSQQ